jgi:hypothetical protein
MALGQKLQNAHLPKASKKRKTAEAVEDVDGGGEITTRRAQQIAIVIEEKFFEGANQTVISVAACESAGEEQSRCRNWRQPGALQSSCA